MNTKQKGWITLIIFPIFLIAVVIGFIGLYTPDPIGKKGVVKEIILHFDIVTIGCCFAIIFFLFTPKKVIRSLPGILTLILAAAAGLFGIGTIFEGIMALNSNPITIENGNYELEYRSSYRGLGTGEYYMVVVNEYSITHIRIDKVNYDYLNSNTPTVTISYYPYINIAAEITYEPDNPQQTEEIH